VSYTGKKIVFFIFTTFKLGQCQAELGNCTVCFYDSQNNTCFLGQLDKKFEILPESLDDMNGFADLGES